MHFSRAYYDFKIKGIMVDSPVGHFTETGPNDDFGETILAYL